MKLKWRSGTVALRCPVCDRTHGQPRVATVAVRSRRDRVTVARCAGCGSALLDPILPPDEAYSGEHWDWDSYLEVGAAIEVIAETVAIAGAPRGACMLDVGCGYGFALDLGTHMCGWTGIGLDPSPAAERGRDDLGLDIRLAYLDPDFEPGAHFDVIVASEVLEHLIDPRAFLREIATRLASNGVAVLTTPNADLVDPATPITTLLAILSAGHHVTLFTPDSLHAMIESVGLTSRITTRGHALCAIMSPTSDGLARVRTEPVVPLDALAAYCRDRAARAVDGSALAVGMAVRGIKFLAYDGRFEEAAAAVPVLCHHLRVRHGIDLDDPDALRAVETPPAVLAAAGYFAGVTARYVDQDPDLADARWTVATRAAETHHARAGRYRYPEIARFEMESIGERALLAAPTAPPDARRLLAALDDAAGRSGDPSVAAGYRPRVEAALGPEPVRTSTARAELERIARGVRRRLPVRRPGP